MTDQANTNTTADDMLNLADSQDASFSAHKTDLPARADLHQDFYLHSPQAHLGISVDGVIRQANLASATLLGTSLPALLHTDLSSYLFDTDASLFNEAYRQVIATGMAPQHDLRVMRADHNLILVQFNFHRLDSSKHAPWVSIYLSDISQRQHSGMGLPASEEFNRLIADNIPGMLAYWTADLRCTFANKQYLTWFGRSIDQMHNMHMRDLMGPELFQKNIAYINGALKGMDQQFERSLIKANGETGHTWAQYIVHKTDGVVLGFFALVTDVTVLKRTQTALLESERHYRTLAEDMPLFVITFLPDGTLTYVNKLFASAVSSTKSALLDRNFFDLLPAADQQMVKVKLSSLTPEQAFEIHEQCYPMPNGELIYHRWTNQAFFNAQNKLVSFQAVGEDISAYKKAEKQLHESVSKNRALIQAIPDLIFTIGHDGRFLDVHAPKSGFIFADPTKLINTKLADTLPSEIASHLLRAVKTAHHNQHVQEIQFSTDVINGKEMIFEARIAPNNADSVIAIVRDVTDVEHGRQQREQQLNARLQVTENDLHDVRQSLTLASDAANLGVWVRDLERDEIWASPQWRSIFGFSADQRLGINDVLQRIHPADRSSMEKLTSNFSIDEKPRYQAEFRIVVENGKIRWIAAVSQVEFDAGQKPKFTRGVLLDITARKQSELELEQKRAEVTHLSRVVTLGELSGALAHELNQPLTAILSNAQAAQRFLMRENADLNEVRDILQDIVDEDKRAGEIIQRLRRLFNKNDKLEQNIDINALIMEVMHILRNDMLNRSINVSTELNPANPWLIADAVQLQQVIINLIMNACDAVSHLEIGERTVTIKTDQVESDRIRVSVIDNGKGIPEENKSKLFDAFYTTKEKGMGLGLSICKNIIEAHGGRLWCENNATSDDISCNTSGASFHFSLSQSSKCKNKS
ncbi:PAS domain-containing sensor histidine kinase [Undibacterium sp. Ji50W]|uniref:PAS domain-containing sensor histidine kinase n=1 Tax=Undibacterium sp. Ji50W TaxID=3413041 RepID=UPI003BF36D03